jgi:hypothetical protein
MAVVMRMEWPGVSAEQYDQLREIVNWENDPAAGGIFHVAFIDDGVFRVVDVWESPEHFQNFVDNRLMPGVAQLGVEGEPNVTITPAHAVWNSKG